MQLFMGEDPDRWDDAMVILCRLLDPQWRPPPSPTPTTIGELMRAHGDAPAEPGAT